MVIGTSYFSDFLNSVLEASKVIYEAVSEDLLIHIYSHLDADGIAAGGIIGKALQRLDARFRIRITQWVDDKLIDEIIREKPPIVIFTDLGTDYASLLSKKVSDIKIIVLDHHQIGCTPQSFLCVNPHIYGIDGAKDISGSGVAYFVAKALDISNVDLAPIAVVGALGDLQDKYDQRMLGGLNQKIVEDAINAGLLTVEKDLIFFGRETRPIHKALAATTSPFIPGISGAEDKVLDLLASLGIPLKHDDKWRALRDLTEDEKKRLCSALADYLLSKGLHCEISNLIGHVYTLTREEPWTPLRDGREFSVLLNATGRMNKSGVGVAICMGDRGKALEEASKILEDYRKTINKYLDWVTEKPGRIQELEYIYVVYGGTYIDDKIIGAISSILSSNLPNPEKPLIACSDVKNEGIVKVSARTTDIMVNRGLNLGDIMQVAAEKCKGKGGGHNIAAGAQIPKEKIEEFINLVNELVRRKLAGEEIGG
ncbi:MAG: DHH family phosphoesterase [Candidatus Bathyarchaeia archaeon]|nr:DHH family phosphoesterase [Candidatus Bathyarchaeota archaeon]